MSKLLEQQRDFSRAAANTIGGFKQFGIGRGLGAHELEDYLESKHSCLNHVTQKGGGS
jgi:hypothetical protein